jgi:two-component system OmpR family response regulator/two-component system response regulator RstA
MRQVLVVEDDPGLGPLLAEYLTEEGFHATVETNGQRAVSRILSERPDLVLLDLNLPGLDGFEVHRAIRPQYDGIVIVLTARRADLDHVAALEMGADDYVTKPVDPRVLFARVKAHLRRSLIERSKRDVEPIRLAVGPLQIDRAARRALIGNARVDLTGLEFELLWTLARAAGTVVGTRYDGLDRGVDSHLSRIRRKLRDAGAASELIFAIRGQGYQLVST